MHIFVTGGSGFIGTVLVDRLRASQHALVTIFDKVVSKKHKDISEIGDVRSIEQLGSSVRAGTAIVHLAAEHRDDTRPVGLYDEVNIWGARNLCAVAREKDVRTIVFTSTVAVYGFAPIGIDESGEIKPFNDYGRSKYEAEQIFREWQSEATEDRTLVIIRPTVVFGEQNRGNVYNLLSQIASGRFVMVGNGENRKSIAYVENVAALIEHCLSFKSGVHIYNYVDKPDFTMNQLVSIVKRALGHPENIDFRLPYAFGYAIGKAFDLVAMVTGKPHAISSIRVKKFCADSVYNTAIDETGFVPPVSLSQALDQTIRHEFVEKHDDEPLYFSE